jgi:DNA-binding HxlR family transcriptional regulator
MASPDPVSRVFGALADPTRRAILTRLAGGEATVTELAEPFDLSMPAISRHIKVLEEAGLVARTRLSTARLSHLEPESLAEVLSWLSEISDAASPYQWPPVSAGGRAPELTRSGAPTLG